MRLNLIVTSLFLVLLLPAVTLAQQPQPEGPPVPPDPQPIIVGPDTFLAQPVTLTGCVYSSIGQIYADNFVVSGSPVSVDEAIAWVIYHPGNVPPALNPTIRFYADGGGGVPGALLSEQTSVPTTRVDTGVDDGVWDLDVYELTLSLVSPVTLDPGTHWFEITDESGGGANRFCWEFGQLDGANGIAGSASSSDNPPQDWNPSPAELAIQLTGNVVPVELESFEIEK